MSQTVPNQHPAVVLRSHYKSVRTLLAIAMIAIVGLTAAVVMVARDDGSSGSVSSPAISTPASPGNTRYDGGPEEGTRGPSALSAPSPTTRYDGGPEEGTRGPGH